mgnify:CR=1 FL=1
MATKQTNLRLTDLALERLDELALQLGLPRSGVMELLLRHAHIIPPRALITMPKAREVAS